MKIKKSSWHAKWYLMNAPSYEDIPKDGCKYLRTVGLSLLLIPFTFPTYAFADGEKLTNRLGFAFMVHSICTLPLLGLYSMLSDTTHLSGFPLYFAGLGCYAAMVGLVVGIIAVLDFFSMRSLSLQVKEHNPDSALYLAKEAYKSFKEKNCPVIEVIED